MNQEHLVMDKKNFSTLGTTPKSQPQEPSRATPKQDGPGSLQLARKPQPRRRDTTLGANGSSLRMDTKKSPTQKSRAEEKPRPRFNNSSRQTGDDSESELNYLPAAGGKKQNFNHLLNFHFAPRERSSHSFWNSFNKLNPQNWHFRPFHANTARPKFNKEHFLQANCQFLVKASGDYTVYNVDPDILVDWEWVEQIIIRITGDNPVCPICLSPPASAKLTRCGHIYCWPCMLHYLALSDKSSRSCPICFESVNRNDLKSVVVNLYRDLEVGEEISMQLMVRSKDSTQIMPLDCKNGSGFKFSKLITVTPVEVLQMVIERERAELRMRLKEDEHCPEVCFIQQAFNQLASRKESVLRELSFAGESVQPEAGSSVEKKDLVGHQGAAAMDGQIRTESSGSVSSEAIGSDSITAKSMDVDGLSYFYQEVSGQNIFLHSLNMAMIWKNFSSDPSKWPQVIQAPIIEKKSMTMSEEERKRYRFLRHLPSASCFQVIEVDLKSLITKDVLKEFEAQIAQRQKRRIERVQIEKKREEKLEQEERKKRAPLPLPKIGSKLDFPACGTDEEYEGLQQALLDSLAEIRLDDEVTEPMCAQYCLPPLPVLQGPIEIEEDYKGYPCLVKEGPGSASCSKNMSFAQAASNQPNKSSKINVLAPNARTATGIPVTKDLLKIWNPESEPDAEEYCAPNYRASVSDAIAKALATHKEDETSSTGNATNAQKKKGRKKGKVLFATGVGMGSN